MGHPVPDDEADRLAPVRSSDVDAFSAVEAFGRLTRLIGSLCDVAVAFVDLVDEQREEFVAGNGVDWDVLARENSICTYAVLDEEVTVGAAVKADPRFAAKETLRDLESGRTPAWPSPRRAAAERNRFRGLSLDPVAGDEPPRHGPPLGGGRDVRLPLLASEHDGVIFVAADDNGPAVIETVERVGDEYDPARMGGFGCSRHGAAGAERNVAVVSSAADITGIATQ